MVVLRPDEELRELESLSLTIKSMFCEREKVPVSNTLEKYVQIDELQETPKANTQAFHTMNGYSTVTNAISRQYNKNFKCIRCSENHPKGQCKVRGPVCYNCGKWRHLAKECTLKQKPQQNNSHKLSLRQGLRHSRTAKFHEITVGENPEFQIVAEGGTNMGTIEYSRDNNIFKMYRSLIQ